LILRSSKLSIFLGVVIGISFSFYIYLIANIITTTPWLYESLHVFAFSLHGIPTTCMPSITYQYGYFVAYTSPNIFAYFDLPTTQYLMNHPEVFDIIQKCFYLNVFRVITFAVEFPFYVAEFVMGLFFLPFILFIPKYYSSFAFWLSFSIVIVGFVITLYTVIFPGIIHEWLIDAPNFSQTIVEVFL